MEKLSNFRYRWRVNCHNVGTGEEGIVAIWVLVGSELLKFGIGGGGIVII